MVDQAHIGSIDDLARFRSQFLAFLSGARVAVEECAMDAARRQAWLDYDRRRHWEGEAWRRRRKLEEARQNLFRESLSSPLGPSSWQQMQVHRAERAFDEAQGKLDRVKAWSRTFQDGSLPIVKRVEQLHTVLSVDMAHAVNFLSQAIAALDAYAGRFPASPRPAAEPVETAEASAAAPAPADSAGAPDAAAGPQP